MSVFVGAHIAKSEPEFFEVHIIAATLAITILASVYNPMYIQVIVLIVMLVEILRTNNRQRNIIEKMSNPTTCENLVLPMSPTYCILPHGNGSDLCASAGDIDKWSHVGSNNEGNMSITGPPSSSLVDGAMSFFLTTEGGVPKDGVVLFEAKASSPPNNDSVTLTLSIKNDPSDASKRILVGSCGSEVGEVNMLAHVSTRTYFIIRANGVMRVGYFDHNAPYEDAVSVEITRNVDATSSVPIYINREGSHIGKICAVSIYDVDMSDQHAEFKRAIIQHTSRSNIFYKEMESELKREITTLNSPKYNDESVKQSCNVSSWSDFTPEVVSSGCREAIATFCKDNKLVAGCGCWNDDGDLYSTNTCMHKRRMYGEDDALLSSPLVQTVVPEAVEKVSRPTLSGWLFG